MKFHQIAPDENYSVLKLTSENGVWELGLTQMIFGVRVRAGVRGDGWCPVDYCGGADRCFVAALLSVITGILETFPEEVTPSEIQKLLPTYERKPISDDPCWEKLRALRMKLVVDGNPESQYHIAMLNNEKLG